MNLTALNIYGLESVADILAAGIFTGEPVILVGEKGTGKTFLCKQIAETLGADFIAYSASTANFEDMIGYPIPHKNKEGQWDKMNFVPTDTSVWGRDFILLDELNRARIDRQNDILQLIRNRSIQGLPINSLKWVWAAVNPLSSGYEGTSALDNALADRFSWIIQVPAFAKITKEDRLAIISNITDDDMPALEYWGLQSEVPPTIKTDFRTFFKQVSRAYPKIRKNYAEAINEYVEELISQLATSADKILIDGRRAGMLKRNILSLAAVNFVLQGEIQLQTIALKALHSSFPQCLVGDPINDQHLQAAHHIAKGLLIDANQRDLQKVMSIKDEKKRLAAALTYNLTPLDTSTIVIDHINKIKHTWQKQAIALALLPKTVNKNNQPKLTADTMATLAELVSNGFCVNNQIKKRCKSYSEIVITLEEQKNSKKPFYLYADLLATNGWHPPAPAEVASFLAQYIMHLKEI